MVSSTYEELHLDCIATANMLRLENNLQFISGKKANRTMPRHSDLLYKEARNAQRRAQKNICTVDKLGNVQHKKKKKTYTSSHGFIETNRNLTGMWIYSLKRTRHKIITGHIYKGSMWENKACWIRIIFVSHP